MIRLLLRLYPPAWRARYGEELVDLVDQTGLGPVILIDVIRAALRERMRALRDTLTGGSTMAFGPGQRHPVAWALAGLAMLVPTLGFVTASVLAYQLGVRPLLAVMDPVSEWLATRRVADLFLVLAPAAALVMAVTPLLRLELRHNEGGSEAVLGVRIKALNIAVGLLALALGAVLAWHIVVESVMQAGA